MADPGRSLILAKPSGAIPHKGGLRFEVGSLDYRVIAEWIAGGVSPPSDDEPVLESVEVLPDRVMLKPGDEQQVLVRAHYSDGRVDDVTRWAKFSSSNEVVAKVDPAGSVTVMGPGEGAIVAWFASKIAIAINTACRKKNKLS